MLPKYFAIGSVLNECQLFHMLCPSSFHFELDEGGKLVD